jgi:hypothetical protein
MSFIRSCVSLPLRAEYAPLGESRCSAPGTGSVTRNADGAWFLFGAGRADFSRDADLSFPIRAKLPRTPFLANSRSPTNRGCIRANPM